MSIKAVAYARFSSDNQRDESIDAQFRAIRKYAEQNDIELISTYEDRAKTGTNADREGLQRMVSDSRNGEFQLVIVHKFDRFARDRLDSVVYKDMLRKNGVRVISVLERTDDTPESRMMEGIMESLNQYYSDNLAREVMKGMKENALSCRYTGGYVPFGYKVNAEQKYEIDDDEAVYVRFIFDSAVKGMCYNEIATALAQKGVKTRAGQLFGKNSIYSILRNEKYTGVYVYNLRTSKDASGKRNNHTYKADEDIIRIEGGVPAIISKEQFQTVQELLDKRKTGTRTRNNAVQSYLLTGKIKCGICGGNYCGNRQRSGRKKNLYLSYRCNIRSRKYSAACNNKEISCEHLDKYVLKLLADMLFDERRIPKVIEEYNRSISERSGDSEQELKAMRKSIAKLEKEINNLINVIAQTGSAALAAGLAAKEAELSDLKAKLEEAQRRSTTLEIDESEIIKAFDYSRQLLISGELPQLHQLVNLYIDEVTVYPDSVSVKLNMINGIQANSNSEELEKLGNIDKEAFSITEDADRKKVIK